MFQQYVFFSETEWNRIRRRTLDGRNKKIEYGGWPGGPAPYGYRIEGKGRKGSFLVVCEGEARVILKAVALLVDDKKSYEDVAEELNRLEMYTRSGKPWTATNLYQRMHSETFDGYTTYRKANRGRRKKATRLHEDGTPVHGEPVRIAVSQILTSDRAEELKAVLKKRSINKPRKPAAIYPLSGHIASDCGQVYIGGGRTGQRAYRCQGNNSGKSGCGCTNLDATEIENAVWSKVTELLADEGRLRALADREIVSLPGDRDKYLERQERLAARIEKQEKLIEDSVPEYIKAGMEPAVAAAAVRKLLEELESWKKQLGEVQHWLSEYEQTRARANAIVSLARSSQERLANLDAADKARIFDMFRIAVLPEKGRFVKRPGAPCTVTAWHHETGTLVPPEVSETQWKTAREVIAQYHGPRHFSMTELDLRQALNGMLHRLRHGAAWTEIEFWGHSEAIRQRQGVWFRSGAWQALMEYLTTDERGTVAYRHPTIPLLHVVSEIRSGVGTFREVAIDAEKIAKAVVGVGADRLSRLPLT
ncbi:recombinase family protein [Streptomyces fulvoviolaceus]|uniref:recombinase family protein n=1 Tax=Streptomyces fulvoviolaceus TaxID=285535 RepID=UPI0021C07535|nr:recombinase family protein [Streptomyces fulvoviolaceus]MCT9083019.1 recombinase family protein [Streptomyces fulvoviolaceus]